MMRSLSTLAAVILWSALSHIAVADDRPAGVPEEAKWVKVDRVVDGDTLVLIDKTRVRLHGIDTPERDQPYGKQATSVLDALIETKVFVEEKDTDRYGRLVGVLYTAEGLNVNLEMVCSNCYLSERVTSVSGIQLRQDSEELPSSVSSDCLYVFHSCHLWSPAQTSQGLTQTPLLLHRC